MWGSEQTDCSGKLIEKLLENDNIVLLNDRLPLILIQPTDPFPIDLTMC